VRALRASDGARTAYAVGAWLFLAVVLVQVFLAGLGLFVGPTGWTGHKALGHWIGLVPALLLVPAWVGRLPRPAVGLAALLLGVYLVQAELFAAVRAQVPVLAALHPVLALVLFTVGVAVARHAWVLVRARPAAAPAGPRAVPDLAPRRPA
jgi:hypothetical protein